MGWVIKYTIKNSEISASYGSSIIPIQNQKGLKESHKGTMVPFSIVESDVKSDFPLAKVEVD